MVADAVAFSQGSPRDLRMRRRISSQKEECRTHALILEGVQNSRSGAGPGAIIECEHELLLTQRQR